MSQIQIFISYSSKDKKIAGYIKKNFENRYGFSVFLAHSDICAASDWEEVIIDHIKNCDFFLVLLTENYKGSDYTSQEIGMAVAWKKLIIPIKFEDFNPYGFISKFQAIPCNELTKENVDRVITTIFFLSINDGSYKKYREKAIDSLIVGLSKSTSFAETCYFVRILNKIDSLTGTQIKAISKVVKTNGQVGWEGFEVPAFKKKIFAEYKIDLDSL